jgi:hypothetical protein
VWIVSEQWYQHYGVCASIQKIIKKDQAWALYYHAKIISGEEEDACTLAFPSKFGLYSYLLLFWLLCLAFV